MDYYKSTASIPSDLKLVKVGDIWDTFYSGNSYIKLLNEKFTRDYSYVKFLQTLNLLSLKQYQMDSIPKILDIYLDLNVLIGYRMEEKKGIPALKYLQNSQNPLREFFILAKPLLKIITEGNLKDIVFKDMPFNDNILYNIKTQEVFLIDIDSFQVDSISDGYTHKKLLNFIKTEKIENYNKKYIKAQVFSTELNYLLFYDFFLQSLFYQSLFNWNKKQSFETFLKELLIEINLPKKSNLYSRIMDLANPDYPNTFAIEDFENLQENHQIDSQRRLIQ